jgi:hypothetical protein
MVDVQVSVEVPGATKVYTPSLAEGTPTQVHVSSTHVTGLLGLLLIVLAVVAVGAVLVALRVRYARHHSGG